MDRITRLKEFLEKEPEDNFLQHALALEYIKTGEIEEAKVLFKNILSLNENYIPSYYHYAKLLVAEDEIDEAMEVYKKGMIECRKAGDNHSFNELQNALEELD